MLTPTSCQMRFCANDRCLRIRQTFRKPHRRLSVADEPTSIADGTVTLDVPWLKQGTLSASASIHRCEYNDNDGGCPLCDQSHDGSNHDTSGGNIDIAKDEYYVLRGAVSPVLVSLSADSDSPADWSISPHDGSAMLHSSPGAGGAYEIEGASSRPKVPATARTKPGPPICGHEASRAKIVDANANFYDDSHSSYLL